MEDPRRNSRRTKRILISIPIAPLLRTRIVWSIMIVPSKKHFEVILT